MKIHLVMPSTLASLSLAASAFAQAPPPAGLRAQTPATSGTTEVTTTGFQAVKPAPDADKDASTLKLTLGGFLSQGNSRALALTGSVDYFLRRGPNQFSAVAAVNYGRSAAGRGEPYEVTVNNQQGRVRYDYFFAETPLAGFLNVSARRDRFQGLDLRLNVDPGLAYYFIDEKEHRFWAELGYDLQYDIRNQDFIDAALLTDMTEIARTEARHNIRGFVGYDNQLSEAVKFSAGLEYLQNVKETENARLNFDAGLTSQLNQDFSVAVTFALKFDNNPLPGVEDTDIISALNLVYTMD